MRKRNAKIPSDVDPAVRFILEQVAGSAALQWRLEVRAKLGIDTIRHWFYGNGANPKIGHVRRVLRALGYDLAVVPLADRREAP